jgi:hypothetical protein
MIKGGAVIKLLAFGKHAPHSIKVRQHRVRVIINRIVHDFVEMLYNIASATTWLFMASVQMLA